MAYVSKTYEKVVSPFKRNILGIIFYDYFCYFDSVIKKEKYENLYGFRTIQRVCSLL